ncbi:WxcM-like domain-containing protein [Candidatus Woesearchaeota archaeon]|nr:WxcM-like domain-containing protein [Candidatus Woesearchaeota archaeon]
MKIIKQKIIILDKRGILKEIAKNFTWKQLNYSITKKGSVRGNHYHKHTSELHFIVKGKLELYIKNLKTNKEYNYLFKKGSCFIIEPYEFHILKYLTYVELIVLLSEEFNLKNPDIYK